MQLTCYLFQYTREHYKVMRTGKYFENHAVPCKLSLKVHWHECYIFKSACILFVMFAVVLFIHENIGHFIIYTYQIPQV